MKQFLLLLSIAFLVALPSNAQVEGINIGDSYESVKVKADKLYGSSQYDQNGILLYTEDISLGDDDWDQVMFNFQPVNGKNILQVIIYQMLFQKGGGGNPKGYLELLMRDSYSNYKWQQITTHDGTLQYYTKYSEKVVMKLLLTHEPNMTVVSLAFTPI